MIIAVGEVDDVILTELLFCLLSDEDVFFVLVQRFSFCLHCLQQWLCFALLILLSSNGADTTLRNIALAIFPKN